MSLTTSRINTLIERRNEATNRRDEQIDWALVDLIDTQLSDVPPGQRNDVDLLLVRTCAVLDERTEYSTQTEQAERDEWLTRIMDQHEDRLDFLQLCGDLAI